jgi:hypothetical protein
VGQEAAATHLDHLGAWFHRTPGTARMS